MVSTKKTHSNNLSDEEGLDEALEELASTDEEEEENDGDGGKRRKVGDRPKTQAQIDRRRERNRILARRTRLRKKFFFESLQKQVRSSPRVLKQGGMPVTDSRCPPVGHSGGGPAARELRAQRHRQGEDE